MNSKEFIELLREKIIEVAENEDKELERLCSEGIFFVPELAFAYLVGKEIMKSDVAKENKLELIREQKISSDYGIADLVLKGEGLKTIVVEFKMQAKDVNYIGDIKKLQKINEDYEKIFCALIDVFPDALESDGRIIKLEETFKGEIERIGYFYHFPTKYSYYQKTTHCLIGIWRVK